MARDSSCVSWIAAIASSCGFSGVDALGFDARFVHEAGVEVADFTRVRRGARTGVRGVLDDLDRLLPRPIDEDADRAIGRLVRRNRRRLHPAAVGVGIEVVAWRDRHVHAGGIDAFRQRRGTGRRWLRLRRASCQQRSDEWKKTNRPPHIHAPFESRNFEYKADECAASTVVGQMLAEQGRDPEPSLSAEVQLHSQHCAPRIDEGGGLAKRGTRDVVARQPFFGSVIQRIEQVGKEFDPRRGTESKTPSTTVDPAAFGTTTVANRAARSAPAGLPAGSW